MKGVSPIISAVLLIAFTLTVASISGPFFTQQLQKVQDSNSEQADKILASTDMHIELRDIRYNRSSGNLSVTVQNRGSPIDNLTMSVLGGFAKSKTYTKGLKKNQIRNVEMAVPETFPISSVSVSALNYPVSAESDVLCAPTRDLEEKIGFDETVWETEGASVKNDSTNSYVGKSSVKVFQGNGGEDAKPKSSKFSLRSGSVYWFAKAPENDDTRRMEINYGGFTENDQIASLTFESNGNFGSSDGSWWNVNSGIEYGHNKWYMFEINWKDDTSRTGGGFYNVSVYDPADKSAIWSKSNLSYNDDSGARNVSEGANFQAHRVDDKLWLDSIRVYSRSLSQAEIERLYRIRSEDLALSECQLSR